MKILSFGSIREDYNTANQLQTGKQMITPPRERLIHNAIKNLSECSEDKNIRNLLTIATNNQYGLRPNSALRKYIEDNSLIKSEVLENNDWNKILQDALQNAIAKTSKNKKEKFLQQYNEIYSKPQTLTNIEKKILKYREKIINSVPMQDMIKDKTKNKETSNALKLLDYFIASSETPLKEKAYVLLRLSYFMSDAYSINPQLKDKKFQVFSEIINDLVIKIPSEDVLTTKDCSQRFHGSCAATSAARKTLLYEDKIAYIDVLLSELNDKDYMEIYDITRLFEYKNDVEKYNKLRAPKIKVDKAKINYERAIFEGYRIIDASALNWMKIAGTIGNGSINLEDYIAFDAKRNGLFHDSRVLNFQDNNYITQHEYLKTIIKSLHLTESYTTTNSQINKKQNKKDENALFIEYSKLKKELRQNIEKYVPNTSESQITNLLVVLKNTKRINILNNDKTLKNQIINIFNEVLHQDCIKLSEENLDKILPTIKNYIKTAQKIKETNSSLTANAYRYQKLYKIGVAQREFLRQQLELSNVDKNLYYDDFNLPDYSTQLQQHLSKLIKLAKTNPNNKEIQKLQKKYNCTEKELINFLEKLHFEVKENILTQIDKNLSIYNIDYRTILIDGIKKRLKDLENGDFNFMFAISDKINTKPNDKKFKKLLNKILEDLNKAQNYEEINNAIRPLGAQDPYETIQVMIEKLVNDINLRLEKVGYENIIEEMFPNLDCQSKEEFINIVNSKNEKIDNLINRIKVIAEEIDFDNENDIIIKKSEKRGDILTIENLNILKDKFDRIYLETNRVRSLQEQGIDAKINKDILLFSQQEKELLLKIEKEIAKFSRVLNREYLTTNKIMKKTLGDFYSDLGKKKGHFWVKEEGDSGLYANESIRILEQMTGRPYHNENDIDAVINHIKEGKGSGTSSTMVDWNDAGAHAQYIADIQSISIKNPKTGLSEEKTIMLHDNTWGHAETSKSWIDEQGTIRTDYNRGFGPKGGFIVTPSLLSGAMVENYKYDTTTIKNIVLKDSTNEDIIYSDLIPIFMSATLPGVDSKMVNKFENILKYISRSKESENTINDFFTKLEKQENKVNIKFLNNFDKLIWNKQEEIRNKIIKNNKAVLTIDDYNKLNKDDELKIIIKKLILAKQFPEMLKDDSINSYFAQIKTENDIEKFKQEKLNTIKDFIRCIAFKPQYFNNKNYLTSYINIVNILNSQIEDKITQLEKDKKIDLNSLKKTIKKNIQDSLINDNDGNLSKLILNIENKVKSAIKEDDFSSYIALSDIEEIKSVISNNIKNFFEMNDIEEYTYNNKFYLNFLDKKFNLIDNEDLNLRHKKLLNLTSKEFEVFMKDLTLEDFGIKFDTPENIIKLLQANNYSEHKRLDKVVLEHFYDELIGERNRNNISTVYRNIYLDLSNLFDEKYINQYKDMYFKKYKVRPAIPNLEVKNKQELIESLNPLIINLKRSISYIKILEKEYDCLSLSKELLNNINSANIEKEKDNLIECLDLLLQLMSNDSNCNNAASILKKMKERLNNSDYDTNKFKIDFDIYSLELKRLIGSNSAAEAKTKIAKEKRVLTHNLEFLIKGNVLPKYQETVKRLFYKWINLEIKENSNEYDSNKLLNIAYLKLLDNHVLTNPSELFSHTVNLIQEKPNNIPDNLYNGMINQLKIYTNLAYQKVNRIKVEYKMMDLASKGMATKLKDFIKTNITLKTEDGKIIEGNPIKLILSALFDPSNNNSTLLQFIEHTGMAEEFLNTIYEEDYKNLNNKIKNLVSENIGIFNAQNHIKSCLYLFLAENKGILINNKEDFQFALDKYFETLLVANNSKRQIIYVDKYLNKFKDIAKNFENIENQELNNIFSTIHETCDENLEYQLNYNKEILSTIKNEINADINLLNSIRIINDEDSKKRAIHLEKINNSLTYLNNCTAYLSELENY